MGGKEWSEGATGAEGIRMETRYPPTLFHYFDLRYVNAFLIKNYFSNLIVTKLKGICIGQNSNDTMYISLHVCLLSQKEKKP